jgi:hypothetical protein
MQENIGQAIAENMRRQVGMHAVDASRHPSPVALRKRIEEARSNRLLVVVRTQSGSVYRIAQGRKTGRDAIAKWRADEHRWSGWYPTVFENPGPMYGIYTDVWRTTPITAWEQHASWWNPGMSQTEIDCEINLRNSWGEKLPACVCGSSAHKQAVAWFNQGVS